MDLKSLFEMQKVLDYRIEQEHPRLEGEDRLAKKILALQVELGELANELPQTFKFWSNKKNDYKKALVEYVDCLHFVLSIGLEDAGSCVYHWSYRAYKTENIQTQITELMFSLKHFNDSGILEDTIELFLGLGEMLGFTWEQIEVAYIKKNEVNHVRQSNNY